MEESAIPVRIQILWDGPGAIAETRCFNCSAMSNVWSPNPGETFSASETERAGGWKEWGILQSEERAGGDRFGAAVAIHREALVISAPQGGAEEAVTWDFETGDLTGTCLFYSTDSVWLFRCARIFITAYLDPSCDKLSTRRYSCPIIMGRFRVVDIQNLTASFPVFCDGVDSNI